MSTRLSIGRLFTHFAATKAHLPALVDEQGATLTWLELDRHTNRLARAYAEADVTKDDTVAVTLPNSLEFFQACVAAWKLGAMVMPVSHKFPPLERRRVLDLARPALVVGSDSVDGERSLPQGFEPPASLSDALLPEVVPTYWKALTSGGSTGLPKLIVSHDDPFYDPAQPEVDYMHADGVHLVCGPLYHNAAFVYAMRGLFCGNQLVVMSRFDPERALDLIERHRVTWTQMVPTMMNRVRRLPAQRVSDADVSSLRTLLHVGGPCPPPLKEAYLEWLGPDKVVEVYAGTESQGITRITGSEWLEHRGSVGRAIRGSRFRVQDDEGNEVPPGTVGEVFLMPQDGQGSTYHYVGAEPRSRDGWESLGDLGYYDEDGYLYLADRSTDCIVTGGANVYPAEVEGAIEAHPGVRACAVIGLPDDDLGQRVVAVVEGGDDLTADALDAHLRPLVAAYKRPRAYEVLRTPLRDEAGKVRRTALRESRQPGGADEGQLVMPSAARWRDLRTGSAAVDALVAALDLDELEPDVFLGRSLERPATRVFGGQVMAQAVVAASRTADPDVVLHSLHSYFACQGDPRSPIRYCVTRLRDGRSFQLRRVDAWQDGQLIGTVTTSLQMPEEGGMRHQAAAPDTTAPHVLRPRYPFGEVPTAAHTAPGAVEIRECTPPEPSDPLAPADVWIRVTAGLPDDPRLHRTLLVFLSDFTILRSAFRGHRVSQRDTRAASLDHAMWLHRPARADRWLLYRTFSPSADSGRALGTGSLITTAGELAATTGQEMVVRMPAPDVATTPR